MISNTWTLSAVELPGGVVHQIQEQDIDPGLVEMMEGGSGTVDAEFAAFSEQAPVLSFTTTAVATALAAAGIGGLAITTATNFWFVKNVQGGTRATGAANLKISSPTGMIVPTVLRAGQRPPASISYDFYAISADGSTAPLSVTNSATLPTIGIASEEFVVGPVGMNSLNLVSVQDVTVNFGMNCPRIGGNGEVYPTFTGIASRNPRISVTDLDMSQLASGAAGVAGLALTSWKTYLRKMTPGSAVRVANGTASHIKISGTTGVLKPSRVRAQHQRESNMNWDLMPSSDGTNPIMVISTGSAIT